MEPNQPQKPLIKIWQDHPRPSYDHFLVIEGLVEGILDDVTEWLSFEDKIDDSEEEVNRIKEDLKKLFTNCHDLDGYYLSKQLNNYNPDARLVEILDSSYFIRSRVHTILVKEWIAQNQEMIDKLFEKFPIGAKVGWKSKWEAARTGAIKSFYKENGQVVLIEDGKDPNRNLVVNIEELILL